jgi:transposase-like protein
MPESGGLEGSIDWIDLGFIERERTPRGIIKIGIQLHIVSVSLSNTKQLLERFGVERSRMAIHNWVQKTDVQPFIDREPDHIAVDETMIQLNDERHWLYAADDPETNEFLDVRLFQTRTTDQTILFLRELKEEVPVTQATLCSSNTSRITPVEATVKRR